MLRRISGPKKEKVAGVSSVLLNSCVFLGMPLSLKNLTEGEPVETDPLQMLIVLNQIGGRHGVGRIDIVENRFIGLKVSIQGYYYVYLCDFVILEENKG
jgi:hypothetical protein